MIYETRVNKRQFWRKKTGSHNEGDDSQFVPFFSESEGSIVQTVINTVFTLATKITVTNYGAHHCTMNLLSLKTEQVVTDITALVLQWWDYCAPTWALDTEPKGLGGRIAGWLYIIVGGFMIPMEPICGGCSIMTHTNHFVWYVCSAEANVT